MEWSIYRHWVQMPFHSLHHIIQCHLFSCCCQVLFFTESRTISIYHNISFFEILKNTIHSRSYKYFILVICLVRPHQLKPNCTSPKLSSGGEALWLLPERFPNSSQSLFYCTWWSHVFSLYYGSIQTHTKAWGAIIPHFAS